MSRDDLLPTNDDFGQEQDDEQGQELDALYVEEKLTRTEAILDGKELLTNGNGHGHGYEQKQLPEKYRSCAPTAPSPLPTRRQKRLQTLAVMFWPLLLPGSIALFFMLLSIPPLWPLLTIYLIWMCFDDAHESGGRRIPFLRTLFIFKYFAAYFPISMIKTADLPADRPYIFGYHPHGIIGMGAVATFATEAMDFSDTFPGITPRLMTLSSNFKIPFYRDIILGMGLCSVSKRSCERALRLGNGSSIGIVVGGAAESLNANPGTADLILKKRLGFIKIAMRNGADLVPVFGFGENDIYEQVISEEGTKIHWVQKKFKAMFGFTLPLFHGRGAFNYRHGLLPYRHPIVSVVGRPIHVTKCDHPTEEQLEQVQAEYIRELRDLWDTWKDSYAAHRRRELTIVD